MPKSTLALRPGAFFALVLAAYISAASADGTPNTGQAFEARALIQADAEINLSSEIAGRIIELPFREGERFTKGDTLVRFDCRAHEGRLQVALASLKAAQLTLTNQHRRAELDATGALEVGLAEADVDKAKGEVATARFPVDRCHIRAPFNGRIIQLGAHPHETIAVGTPLMRILDDSLLEIKIVVPSQWLSWLRPGAPFDIRIDETGETLPGAITRMGAAIDAVSQSLPVYSNLKSTPGTSGGEAKIPLISGMSGLVTFRAPPHTTLPLPRPRPLPLPLPRPRPQPGVTDK